VVGQAALAGLDVTALGGSREALLVLGFLTSDTVTDVSATSDTVSDVQGLVGAPTALYRVHSASCYSSQHLL
jgi:hypothetical protein